MSLWQDKADYIFAHDTGPSTVKSRKNPPIFSTPNEYTFLMVVTLEMTEHHCYFKIWEIGLYGFSQAVALSSGFEQWL